MNCVVALAGAPASGKTTVARAVGEAIGAPRISFGDMVRTHAHGQGLIDNRTGWQGAGSQLRAQLGPEGLVRAALAHAELDEHDVPVVWDGVRHVDVAAALRTIYRPHRVVLAALCPPEAERRARFLVEAGTEDQLERWERHESEQHLAELCAIADVVCRHEEVGDAVDAVLDCLGRPAA